VRYLAVVRRGKEDDELLAGALLDGKLPPATVYVVGIDEAHAFGLALLNGAIDGDKLSVKDHIKFRFVETIGVEDWAVTLPALMALAKKRIWELERTPPTHLPIRRTI
jgi:hypothetical protein